MAAATAASGAVLPAGVEFAYTAPAPETQTDEREVHEMALKKLELQVRLRNGLGAYFWWSLSVVDVFAAICWPFFKFWFLR